MQQDMRRIYLYNRQNDKDTITYIKESILTALNAQICSFLDLNGYIAQPARKAALNRLDACEHDAPSIEVTPIHHSLMGWEAYR